MTTPTPDTKDPVLELLQEFMRRDTERNEALAAMHLTLQRIETEQRGFVDRTKKDFIEVKGELQRQDGQIGALDARIGGNYRGQAAQIELVLGEMRVHGERLTNIERAVIETSRDTHTLHGRLIETTDSHGQRIKKTDLVVDGIVRRLDEMLPPSIDSVEAASSG